MKEISRIFTADSVRAILNENKTQTRRLDGLKEVNKNPNAWFFCGIQSNGNLLFSSVSGVLDIKPRYQVGDRIWVRETFFDHNDSGEQNQEFIEYRANEWIREADKKLGKWTSPMFMPRWSSRITLEITEVRIERLQDISEDDAIAEGIEIKDFEKGTVMLKGGGSPVLKTSYRSKFIGLWNKINGKKSDWDLNHWVNVVSFEIIKRRMCK